MPSKHGFETREERLARMPRNEAAEEREAITKRIDKIVREILDEVADSFGDHTRARLIESEENWEVHSITKAGRYAGGVIHVHLSFPPPQLIFDWQGFADAEPTMERAKQVLEQETGIHTREPFTPPAKPTEDIWRG
jgi:hypothetical protein